MLQIDETTVPIRFADNETAMALQKRLPLTMQMKELNGNEKYHYVPFSFRYSIHANWLGRTESII
ncbi:MAG TPA: hypothetical protein DCY39_06620 [Exiguobacterium sp.]|nr:hypothetical protein [Exiguobacterium sp.]